LSRFIRTELNDIGLDELDWRDLGKGVSIARLGKENQTSLVFYRISRDAAPDAFSRHEHLEGEVYLVLRGGIQDEFGSYREGEIVYLDSGSIHTPRGLGETVVLVLWPGGIRLVEPKS
jgi:anti-sigma factor ChrR (cupin superfamily)